MVKKMNIHGCKKNKYNYASHNHIYPKKNNNCNSYFHSLMEVEHFLCNLQKAIKCMHLYKFFK